MTGSTVALVTGANKGIGYEIAAQLGAKGWLIAVGARDERRREDAVAALLEKGVDAFGVALDVTDDASVAAAARAVEEKAGGLDVLVNNAGIPGEAPQDPSSSSPAMLQTVLDTNVFGVLRVTNAMLPLLRRSRSPRIVNMSSSLGSMARQHDPDYAWFPISSAYATSKAMLNSLTVQYVRELRGTGILINVACPGFVATDLNNFQGTGSAAEGAAIAVRLATLPDDGPNGGFFEDAGTIPW